MPITQAKNVTFTTTAPLDTIDLNSFTGFYKEDMTIALSGGGMGIALFKGATVEPGTTAPATVGIIGVVFNDINNDIDRIPIDFRDADTDNIILGCPPWTERGGRILTEFDIAPA